MNRITAPGLSPAPLGLDGIVRGSAPPPLFELPASLVPTDLPGGSSLDVLFPASNLDTAIFAALRFEVDDVSLYSPAPFRAALSAARQRLQRAAAHCDPQTATKLGASAAVIELAEAHHAALWPYLNAVVSC